MGRWPRDSLNHVVDEVRIGADTQPFECKAGRTMNLLLILLRFLLGFLPHETARLQPAAVDPQRAKRGRERECHVTCVHVPGWGWLTLRSLFCDGPVADDVPAAGCMCSNAVGRMRAQANNPEAS
jgi:hypothetical protein